MSYHKIAIIFWISARTKETPNNGGIGGGLAAEG
jgi:hypothetical protein